MWWGSRQCKCTGVKSWVENLLCLTPPPPASWTSMLFNGALVSLEICFSFGTRIWVTFTLVKSCRVPQGKGETCSEYILRKCTQKLDSLQIPVFLRDFVIGMFSLNSWGWKRCPETQVQPLCSEQDQLQQVAHIWSGFWLSPRMEAPQCLWAACCRVCPPPKKVFSCLNGMLFCWIWAHCPIFCHLLLNITKKKCFLPS